MEEFHRNFPSFEKEYYRIENQQLKDAETYRKNMFHLQHPFVRWGNLQSQSDTIMTDDGCIHYRHKITNKIYSWNFSSNKWIQTKKGYQNSLLSLFFIE